jgi:predicted nucleic acid-binding protein
VGLIIDSSVLIHFERTGRPVEFSDLAASEEIFLSVVTVSELLVGVHRANTEERRKSRHAFVEQIISTIAALDFTTPVARIHSEICAGLQQIGQPIGAHDMIIAATAKFHGLGVVTKNAGEFSRVPNLRVIAFDPKQV